MAVGVAALDVEDLIQSHQVLAAEGGADEFDHVRGQGGEVGQGAVLDLAIFAKALAEQGVGVELAFVLSLDYGDVDWLRARAD
jgi:hypothetical protein